jgi:hypothetical protein
MKLLTKDLEDSHNLFLAGDLHDGSVLSSRKGWKQLLDMMNSEYEGCSNNYGIDMGDMIEAIMVDDPRFSEEKLTEPLPLEQMKQAIKLREPIKDKLLTILMGNHERKLWRFGNITREVCEALGVSYGTYTAKVSIRDKKRKLMYKLYATHGSKTLRSTADDPIRRQANLKLSLKRHLKFMAGDCAVMVKGHAHLLLVAEPESELYLVDDGTKIKQAYTTYGQHQRYIHPDARWYGCTGSFLTLFGEGVSGYAEIAEYDPLEIGFLVLKTRDRQIVALEPVRLKL